ncbi:hypothetical protein GCM10010512_22720 [Streptomyces thermoviolaceus subsp. thermoviolaceus]|nr:hypothetical protein GCM10010512_22720 [Streptomyces thermoviolaceus subsp. thermoviolaceus]
MAVERIRRGAAGRIPAGAEAHLTATRQEAVMPAWWTGSRRVGPRAAKMANAPSVSAVSAPVAMPRPRAAAAVQ